MALRITRDLLAPVVAAALAGCAGEQSYLRHETSPANAPSIAMVAPSQSAVAQRPAPAPFQQPQPFATAFPPAVRPAGPVQLASAQEPAPFAAENSKPQPEVIAPAPPPVADQLTLIDLEQMALASNPSIAQAMAAVQMARGNWVQVGLRPNPTTGYEGQQVGSAGRAEQHGVYVGQDFVRGGKLGLNREVAAQEIFRAEHRLAAQQQRVLTDVRVAFYNVFIAQRQESLASDLTRIATEQMQAAENLFNKGQVGKLDTFQAQIEFENAEILAVNARNRRAAAWDILASVIGHPHLALQTVDGELEGEVPLRHRDEVLGTLLTSSPEIAAAMANIERARWALERARVEKVPDVSVRGMVNVIDNGIGGRPDGTVTVGMPLPLWNRNQGGIFQAEAAVAEAERSLQRVELSLQNRLAPVFERYSNALNQVSRYRSRILPAAKQSLDLTRQLYDGGEAGYTQLLIVQRTFAQTNFAYLEAIRQLRESAVTMEGLLLYDSLKTE